MGDEPTEEASYSPEGVMNRAGKGMLAAYLCCFLLCLPIVVLVGAGVVFAGLLTKQQIVQITSTVERGAATKGIPIKNTVRSHVLWTSRK